MRVSNQMMANTIQRNLSKQTERLIKLQEQISTGRLINRPSDDPIGMAQALSYRKNIASLDQYNENIANAKLHIELMDSILEAATDLLDEAKRYVADAQTDFNTTYADQVSDLREQMLGLANSKSNGNFLFAGDINNAEPFDVNGVYSGDDGAKEFLIGDNGSQVGIESDGSVIFGTSPNSIFEILDNLETALNAGDPVAVQAQLTPITDAIENFDTIRSINAGKYKLLEATESHYEKFKVNVQGMLSSVEDADMAQSVIELQVQEASYESTLATAAQIIRPSLIDFLT